MSEPTDFERLLEALQPERMLADLAALRGYGGVEGGGVHRLALTSPDVDSRRALESALRESGLVVETDAVGNVWARVGDPSAPAVVSGSHLDTVANGGYLDGALGVLAALEVARAMHDAGLVPASPYEVVSFTGAEGSRFARAVLGSSAASGALSLDEALATTDADGVSLARALRDAGYPEGLPPPRPPEDRFLAFVELHVEQGAVLDAEGIGLGIVGAVSGLVRLDVEIGGVASHAGTTPMDLRKDALAAASEMIVRIEQRSRQANGRGVATVCRLAVAPGTDDVVPGIARFGVDIRSVDPALLETLERDVRRVVSFVANVRGVPERIDVDRRFEPRTLDGALVERATAVCQRIGETSRGMDSHAVHDALQIAAVAPSAMLFVPSKGGRSHVPDEETPKEDLVRGLRALAALVWDLCEAPPRRPSSIRIENTSESG